MTKAEKQKMQARERARRHYEKKKAARANSALENDVEPLEDNKPRHLRAVEPESEQSSQTDEVSTPAQTVETEPTREPLEQKESKPADPSPPLVSAKGGKMKGLALSLRGLMILAVTVLMGILQYDFYRQHDVTPEFAAAFAAAIEIGFFSLVTLKFEGAFDWVRRIILGVLFLYFAATLIFQIGFSAREKVIKAASIQIEDIDLQIRNAQNSLDAATKGRSWENMAIFGKQVADLQSLKASVPKTEALGVNHSEVALYEAALLVVMRVLLLAISGLNTVRLREGLKA